MKKIVCKAWGKKLLILIWGIWWIFSVGYFAKVMIPALVALTVKEPYTSNSVWHYGSTGYLNDILLYTLFMGKNVYINPESWYFNYAEAYADELIVSENVVAMKKSTEIQRYNYTNMGKMCITVNDVLFSDEILESISSNELGGVTELYINEKEILESESIEIFHDENGNIYLEGYGDE